MNNLKRLLIQPLLPVRNSVTVLVLLVALIGFADATYLAFEHYQGVVPPCTITEGCEDVLTSSYAIVAGIPVSLLGAIYYFLILVGAFAYLESKNEKLFRYSLYLTFFGVLCSLWFVYLQVFVIHSYCTYCLLSALTTTILFIIAILIFKNKCQPRSY
jgi:uncharacterized membrane protein